MPIGRIGVLMTGSSRNGFFALSVFVLFFAACSREIPYTIILQDGEYSHGEEAAELAEMFYKDLNGESSAEEIRINADGSASILRAQVQSSGPRNSKQEEILRFYFFGAGDWIAVLPQGFYTVPAGTFAESASRLLIKTKKEQFLLSQFSSFLLRPDVVDSFVRDEKTEIPFTLSSLLKEPKRPPVLLAFESLEERIFVRVKTSEEGGFLAFWGLGENTAAELLAVLDLDENARNKYRQKGEVIYETFINAPSGFRGASVGVSAFNREKTLESKRSWMEYNDSFENESLAALGRAARPNLHVLLSGFENELETLLDLFSVQEQGGLYSRIIIHREEHNAQAMNKKFETLSREIGEEDIFVLFLKAASADTLGDYVFFDGNAGDNDSWKLTENFLPVKSRRTFLFLETHNMSTEAADTALARLGRFLGTRTAMANCVFDRDNAGSFMLPVTGNRYLSAGEFISLVQNNFPAGAGKTKFFTGADFPFLDIHIGYGEIRMQTMFSGTVSISGMGNAGSLIEAPSLLSFGETMIRRLPAGLYTVTMSYRNGRRETKTADVARNSSRWVNFTYVPELLEGSFSRLPRFGVNISELNPANYRRADASVLKAMAVPAWQIAFVSGEDLYRRERYREAIAEYSRAVSLKNDYTAAYVSRGNAYRKTGDSARAIDDYTRALRLKPDFAEIYNFRGYLYSQRGDMARAIDDYNQALRYRTDYADALFNRAYAYSKQGGWDEAIRDYNQVIRLEPNNAAAYSERGRIRQNRGDEDGARADLERAAALRNR